MVIIFAGGSHVATPGYKSLCKYFDRIYIFREGVETIDCEKRSVDVIIDNFNDVECKYVFLSGYARIITDEQLSKKFFINQHGSLLPKYRGMHSIFYAIMNGEKQLGLTYHLVNKFIDAGDIIKQYSFEYTGQTIKEISQMYEKIIEQESGMVCYNYITGKILPIKQDESIATYVAKRNLDDCIVDFNMPNKYMRRFFAALNPPYPYPILAICGKKYSILDGYQVLDRDYYGPIGRVVNKDDQGVWIKTVDGFLIIKNVCEVGTNNKFNLSEIVPIGYRFN